MAENSPRLSFLLTALDAKGMTKADLARMMGVTPQNIFTYLKRDDMKLSFAQEIFHKMGYTLSFRLEAEDAPSRDVQIDLEGLVGKDGLTRLAFLRVAMGRYGITRKALAEKLDIGYSGVNRWFAVDDISISYLYEIAEIYNLKVKIKAQLIKEKDSDTMEFA